MSRLFGSKICKREYLSSEVARVAKARLCSRLRDLPMRDSGIREIFACGIRNLEKVCLWNPEYSCRNPESY